MLAYALVGSNDLEKAKHFFDALLGSAGIPPLFDHQSGGRMYGERFDKPFFGVIGPFNEQPATVGNGTQITFALPSRAAVDAFHAKALELGGANEGDPGIRGDPSVGFYGAYFRDLDGNKLCACHIGG